MSTTSAALIAAAAFIICALGTLHLLLTFNGTKLWPKDTGLKASMENSSPQITRQTTMWKTWIGFNASHSLGAMLFGLVFAYLALAEPALFFQSYFLQAVGMVALLAYVVLGWRYWFSVPFRGICLATLLYALGLALSRF